MTSSTARTTTMIVGGLLLPTFIAAWVILGSTVITASIYAMLAALGVAMATVAINTWKNAQAPISTSQMIHQAEMAQGARHLPPQR